MIKSPLYQNDGPALLSAGIVSSNYEALPFALQAILLGDYVPAEIVILANGEDPPDSFYFRQSICLAKMRGVSVSVINPPEPVGIRQARDRVMKAIVATGKNYVWFVDDDVIPAPYCLSTFLSSIKDESEPLAYYQGSKADVSNVRGYKDFSRDIVRDTVSIKEPISQNMFFDPEFFDKVSRGDSHMLMDSGNVVIDAKLTQSLGIKFTLFEDSVNSGGSDATFAVQCTKAELMRKFLPGAQAFHLEKPNVNFTDQAARKEMVIQVCNRLSVDPKPFKEQLFPWIK